MRTKAVLLTVTVAALHFVLMLVSFFAVLGSELGGHPPWWALLIGRGLGVLGFPAVYVIGRWTPSLLELSNGATLAIAFGSSLLWGVTVTAIWLWLSSSWWLRRRAAEQ